MPGKCLLCNYCKQLLQWDTGGSSCEKMLCSLCSCQHGALALKGRCRGGQAPSCADLKEERLKKCEQEGLEQSRGAWGSPHHTHVVAFILILCFTFVSFYHLAPVEEFLEGLTLSWFLPLWLLLLKEWLVLTKSAHLAAGTAASAVWDLATACC